MSHMSHRMGYRWVACKSQDGLWLTDESHVGHVWVAHGSQDGLQVGHIRVSSWVTDESLVDHTLLHLGLR